MTLSNRAPRITAYYTQVKQAFHKGLNKLDKQSKEIILIAEKKCHCIKSGRIPFLPEAALWICRTQVYWSLLNTTVDKFKTKTI